MPFLFSCPRCTICFSYCAVILFHIFPEVFFHSRVTGACPVTTDCMCWRRGSCENNRWFCSFIGRIGTMSTNLCNFTPLLFFVAINLHKVQAFNPVLEQKVWMPNMLKTEKSGYVRGLPQFVRSKMSLFQRSKGRREKHTRTKQ